MHIIQEIPNPTLLEEKSGKKILDFELFKTKFLPAFFLICLAVPKNRRERVQKIFTTYIYLYPQVGCEFHCFSMHFIFL